MGIDNKGLLSLIQKLNEEIKKLGATIIFINLLNDNSLIKKADSIILLQGLINRNLQVGNYRSVLHYVIALNILVRDLKRYDIVVREKITHFLLM